MRGNLPGHEGNVTELRTRTRDDVELVGVLVESPAGADGPAIVVSHGITNHVHKPYVARTLRRLSRTGAVIAFDLRGHGMSSGRSTIGDREVLDVEAAVDLARRLGHRRVGSVGFSLGASVALRHAACFGSVDAVVAVSSPSRWWVRDTVAMRRVHWLVESPAGRAVAPLLGVRLADPWGEHPPLSPLELVDRIPPTPLLFVQGAADHYFPEDHGRALSLAAGETAELWIERGMRHAESAMTPELLDHVAGWLARNTVGVTPAGNIPEACTTTATGPR